MKLKFRGIHSFLWLIAAALWAVVLSRPWPRNLVRSSCDHAGFTDTALNAVSCVYIWDSGWNPTSLESLAVQRNRRVVEQRPMDRDARLFQCMLPIPYRNSAEIRRLLRDFPNDPVVISYCLTQVTFVFRYARPPGKLDLPVAQTSALPVPASGTPSPPSVEPVVPRTPEELKTWRELEFYARRVSKLEPHNRWFDWNLIVILMQLGRDDEALRILLRPISKSYYHDHLEEVALATIRARTLQGCLSPNECGEQEQYYANRSYEFEFTARWIMEHAYSASLRGDDDRAVAIGVALLRWGRLIRLSSSQISESLGGSAVEKTALFAWKPGFTPFWPRRRPLFGSRNNLVGFTAARGFKAESRETAAEWTNIKRWESSNLYVARRSRDLVTGQIENGITFYLSGFVTSFEGLVPLSLLAGIIRFSTRKRGSPPDVPRSVAPMAAVAGLFGLILLLGLAVAFTRRESILNGDSFYFRYYPEVSTWIVLPFTCSPLLFVVVYSITRWLRSLPDRPPTLIQRMNILEAGPTSWVAHSLAFYTLAPQLGLWVLSLTIFGGALFNTSTDRDLNENLFYAAMGTFPVLTLWQFCLWRRIRGKRMASRIACVFLRASSLYAAGGLIAIALAYLAFTPTAIAFEKNYEINTSRGSLKVARTILGL